MRTSIVPWPLVLVSLLAATPVSAAPYDSYAGFDLGYQFGDFDTANDETLYSISARLGAVGERFEASITFPYVFVESDEQGYIAIQDPPLEPLLPVTSCCAPAPSWSSRVLKAGR